jgi:stage II sporulation protein R
LLQTVHTGGIPGMDGVFMRILRKLIGFGLALAAIVWIVSVITDRQQLNDNIIRLHVVAHSDSEADQALKLQVRDAVIDYLQEDMEQLEDPAAAKEYLQGKLTELETVANNVLHEAGCLLRAVVTLTKESFAKRDYLTFSLPAGVYESLRIVIGEGVGQNWWCVVFPRLCLPATAAEFEDTAAGAGFDQALTDTLQQKKGYQVRFFFLDCLGWLEKLFFHG